MNIKMGIMSAMQRMMINCEEATYLISKKEDTKIGCRNKINLVLHLTACKLCRRFNTQIKIISSCIKKYKQLLHNDQISNTLSDKQKSEIQSVINNKTKKS